MALQEDQLTTYVQYTAQRLVCLTTQFASSSALRIDPGSEAPDRLCKQHYAWFGGCRHMHQP